MSDDQAVEYEQREYVATGRALSSQDDTLPTSSLPLHAVLPPRAAADMLPESVPKAEAMAAASGLRSVTPETETGSMQSESLEDTWPNSASDSLPSDLQGLATNRTVRLCRFVDADSANPTPSQQLILRADAAMLSELAQLANERLDQLQSKHEKPKATKKRKVSKKSGQTAGAAKKRAKRTAKRVARSGKGK
jgi:hypothetical protein